MKTLIPEREVNNNWSSLLKRDVNPLAITSHHYSAKGDLSRALGNHQLQTKLKIGAPNDRYEQEADRVAEQVMHGAERPTVNVAGSGLSSHTPLQRKCSVCEEDEQHVQRKALVNSPQQSVFDVNATSAPAQGKRLTESERNLFEPRFGRDFRRVRIHTNPAAHRAAALLKAKAFTVGNNIVFGKDQYRPESVSGQKLMAHELTHTLQQNAESQIRLAPDHTVQAKETLYSIATLYGLSVGDLQSANGLKDTSIKVGDVLKVPNPVTYTVKPKETLFLIATRFGVSVSDLKTLNGLKSDVINEGDALKIPSVTTRHIVSGKETLFSIAKRYSVSVDAIKKVNKLSTDTIQVGDVLIIPGVVANAPPLVKTPPKASEKPTPAKTQPKTPTVSPPASTMATGSAGSFAGHEPGKEYASGKILERSFVRKADLTTIQAEASKSIFFELGTTVTFKSSKGLFIEVSGEAFTDTKAPKKIMSGATPKLITGWIKREWTDMTRGRFNELEITDSSHFKDKAGSIDHVGYDSELPKADVKNIVMHQTGGLSAPSTISEYQRRVLKGSSIATHYLIGRDGKIFLTGGVDRLIDHVGPATGTVKSANALGIEHSGEAHSLTQPAVDHKHKDFAAEMKKVRAEIQGLTLSPEFKKSLLAKKDKDLFLTLKWSGWQIYEDITAEQKRASHLLSRNLRSEFGMGIGGIQAHEKVSKKTIGEGENITELHLAMESYPAKVGQLESLAKGITALNAIVLNEKAVLRAVTLDATKSENDALAKEKTAKAPGLATARENLRVKFYANFYTFMFQLNDMVDFLSKAAGKPDSAVLAKKIAAWRM